MSKVKEHSILKISTNSHRLCRETVMIVSEFDSQRFNVNLLLYKVREFWSKMVKVVMV